MTMLPKINRRQALAMCGTMVLGWGLRPGITWADEVSEGPYLLPPLPYEYDALAPHIDQETMQFHHDKHHAAYVKNLNGAIKPYPQWSGLPVEDLIQRLNELPRGIQTTVRNNGGGHANHSLFWESMSPAGGGEPTGDLAVAINQAFGSFATFQAEFNAAGLKQFGSGWVWLGLTPNQQLKILTTANQDSPLMQRITPLLGNDVWEHAYYLAYRNRRDQYLQAWWQVVNWDVVANRFAKAVT